MTLYYIITAILVAINATFDVYMIKKNKTINHTLEYFIFWAASLLLTIGFVEAGSFSLSFTGILLTSFGISTLARLAFFNIISYLERDLPLDYQSTQTTSLVDKLEHKLWDSIWVKFKVRIKDIFVSFAVLAIYIYLIWLSL